MFSLKSLALMEPGFINPSILSFSAKNISSLVFNSVSFATLAAFSPAIFPNTCVSAKAFPPKRLAP